MSVAKGLLRGGGCDPRHDTELRWSRGQSSSLPPGRCLGVCCLAPLVLGYAQRQVSLEGPVYHVDGGLVGLRL